MRIFNTPQEVMTETFRDVREMGHEHTTQSMQDKQGDFLTREIICYQYCLTDIGSKVVQENLDEFFVITKARDWADAELLERVSGIAQNPGTAYELRIGVWDEYLRKNNGKFSYSYSERIAPQLHQIIRNLMVKNGTRQAVLSIWNPDLDIPKIGDDRVPCSIFYNFFIREGKLHCHYHMRSCDIATHFGNDVYLAIHITKYIASHLWVELGNLYHSITSFHLYEKDFYLL